MKTLKSIIIYSIVEVVLTLLFVGLKLSGVVDWSWWWVFSPVLIVSAFEVVVLIAFGIYLLIKIK